MHQLSKQAFNALLKNARRAAGQRRFIIMATTELSAKVPDTIPRAAREFDLNESAENI